MGKIAKDLEFEQMGKLLQLSHGVSGVIRRVLLRVALINFDSLQFEFFIYLRFSLISHQIKITVITITDSKSFHFCQS